MTHELKIKPEFFIQVLRSLKTFELRKNDRDYKVGDWLRLREFNNGYTDSEVMRKITYILSDCEEYGLKDGFVILGLR